MTIDPLPATMRCIEISEPGGPDVLKPAERPVPAPGPNDVLIKVAAAGVNRPDIFQRMGHYPPPKDASDLPGLEVAGRVAAIGSNVSHFTPGDAVCALVPGGGYAEYVTSPEVTCLPAPTDDMIAAAAIPETTFTVWYNVFDVCGLKPGERLLVHGGGSGIGTTAIQMARLLGSEVVTTAGSDEKCDAARRLGASLAINYQTSDFQEAIEAEFGRKSIHVVLDMVGGDYVEKNLAVMAEDGRLAFIAFLRGSKPAFDLIPVMAKRLTLTGSTMRRLPLERKARVAKALEQNIWPHIRSGRFQPLIDATFNLENAKEAHKRLEEGSVTGKVVLKVA